MRDLHPWATTTALTALTAAVWVQHRRTRQDAEVLRDVRSIVTALGAHSRDLRGDVNALRDLIAQENSDA